MTEAGLVLELGRSVRLNVEEEIRRGLGPAPTLLQHMVELTALAALNNLKHVTLILVQVGLKFALVSVHSRSTGGFNSVLGIASTTQFSHLPPYVISAVHNHINRDIGTRSWFM